MRPYKFAALALPIFMMACTTEHSTNFSVGGKNYAATEYRTENLRDGSYTYEYTVFYNSENQAYPISCKTEEECIRKIREAQKLSMKATANSSAKQAPSETPKKQGH